MPEPPKHSLMDWMVPNNKGNKNLKQQFVVLHGRWLSRYSTPKSLNDEQRIDVTRQPIWIDDSKLSGVCILAIGPNNADGMRFEIESFEHAIQWTEMLRRASAYYRHLSPKLSASTSDPVKGDELVCDRHAISNCKQLGWAYKRKSRGFGWNKRFWVLYHDSSTLVNILLYFEKDPKILTKKDNGVNVTASGGYRVNELSVEIDENGTRSSHDHCLLVYHFDRIMYLKFDQRWDLLEFWKNLHIASIDTDFSTQTPIIIENKQMIVENEFFGNINNNKNNNFQNNGNYKNKHKQQNSNLVNDNNNNNNNNKKEKEINYDLYFAQRQNNKMKGNQKKHRKKSKDKHKHKHKDSDNKENHIENNNNNNNNQNSNNNNNNYNQHNNNDNTYKRDKKNTATIQTTVINPGIDTDRSGDDESDLSDIDDIRVRHDTNLTEQTDGTFDIRTISPQTQETAKQILTASDLINNSNTINTNTNTNTKPFPKLKVTSLQSDESNIKVGDYLMNYKTTMTLDSIDSQTPGMHMMNISNDNENENDNDNDNDNVNNIINGDPRMMNKGSFIMSANSQTVTIENQLLSASDVETRYPSPSTSVNENMTNNMTSNLNSNVTSGLTTPTPNPLDNNGKQLYNNVNRSSLASGSNLNVAAAMSCNSSRKNSYNQNNIKNGNDDVNVNVHNSNGNDVGNVGNTNINQSIFSSSENFNSSMDVLPGSGANVLSSNEMNVTVNVNIHKSDINDNNEMNYVNNSSVVNNNNNNNNNNNSNNENNNTNESNNNNSNNDNNENMNGIGNNSNSSDTHVDLTFLNYVDDAQNDNDSGNEKEHDNLSEKKKRKSRKSARISTLSNEPSLSASSSTAGLGGGLGSALSPKHATQQVARLSQKSGSPLSSYRSADFLRGNSLRAIQTPALPSTPPFDGDGSKALVGGDRMVGSISSIRTFEGNIHMGGGGGGNGIIMPPQSYQSDDDDDDEFAMMYERRTVVERYMDSKASNTTNKRNTGNYKSKNRKKTSTSTRIRISSIDYGHGNNNNHNNNKSEKKENENNVTATAAATMTETTTPSDALPGSTNIVCTNSNASMASSVGSENFELRSPRRRIKLSNTFSGKKMPSKPLPPPPKPKPKTKKKVIEKTRSYILNHVQKSKVNKNMASLMTDFGTVAKFIQHKDKLFVQLLDEPTIDAWNDVELKLKKITGDLVRDRS